VRTPFRQAQLKCRAATADIDVSEGDTQVMLNRAWIAEVADAATTIGSWLRAIWVRDIWPLVMTTWILFVLAAPLILVILILWYLDSSGWRAGNGFYTIGSATNHLAPAWLPVLG
jgi:hypothetical protein